MKPLYFFLLAVAAMALQGCGVRPSGVDGERPARPGWAAWLEADARVREEAWCGALAEGNIPSAWLVYAELPRREADRVEECFNRLDSAIRRADAVLSTGLGGTEAEAVRGRKTALERARTIAAARTRLQGIVAREFRLIETSIRFTETGIVYDTRWDHASTLDALGTLMAQTAATTLPELAYEAERLAPLWAAIDPRIEVVLRARAEAARGLAQFLALRSGPELRAMLRLLDEIHDRGLFIRLDRDYANPTTSRRVPGIAHATSGSGDATGLSYATIFTPPQIAAQNEVVERARAFAKQARALLDRYQGATYAETLTNQVSAQLEGAELIERYVDARRAECDALRQVQALETFGVRFEIDRFANHATIDMAPMAAPTPEARSEVRERLTKLRLRLSLLRRATDGRDFGGAHFARYQAYPARLTSWLEQEIQQVDKALAGLTD